MNMHFTLDPTEENKMPTTDTQAADPTQSALDVKSVSERLARNYQKEAELYQSILKLTELQYANLDEAGDIRDFIALLRQKEDLIRAIDKIELEIEKDKALWLEAPEKEKDDCNEELNAVLDSIIEAIENTVRVEHGNEELLRTRKDEVEQQLETIRKGRKAAEGYKTKRDEKVISAIS